MRLLVLLIWTIPAISLGQVISVDFEDNDLTGWQQNNLSRWQISSIDPIQGNYSLQHAYDNAEEGTDWIALFHNPIDFISSSTTWEFSIRYNYKPSSSNNWAVFLAFSDLPDNPEDIENAVVFGVNYQGNNDEIAFWRNKNSIIDCIYSTGFNWEEKIRQGQTVSFRIERSATGILSVYIDTTGSKFSLIGTTQVAEVPSNNGFMLYYKYTSTYDLGLSFDKLKIYGSSVKDETFPEVEIVKVLSPQEIEIDFTEIIKVIGSDNFCINGIGCSSSNCDLGKSFKVDIPHPLKAGSHYLLILPELSDMAGNKIISDKMEYNFYYPGPYDILINEILADPGPPITLPQVEYIELYNRTDKKISLDGWHLSSNKSKVVLPSYTIESKKYVVLCEKDSAEIFRTINNNILGIENFPSIHNEECLLILTDASNRMIHSANFSSDWYESSEKKEGGWSVEMVNPYDPCNESENWKESKDYSGGTPGKENSVLDLNVYNALPELYRVSMIDSFSLILYFSEPLDSNSLTNPAFFNVDHGIGNPYSVLPSLPLADKVTLRFKNKFLSDVNYEISLTADITDCSGNTVKEIQSEPFSAPADAVSNEIIINEIMFDPAEGEAEYIELFNNSAKTINLKDWYLGIGDTATSLKKITNEYFLMPPESYMIISGKLPKNMIVSDLPYRKSLLILPDMAALSNEGNQIFLLDNKLKLIDQVDFNPELQHNIIENTKGVSVERINPDISGDNVNNWQSASSDAGYKTPGMINSQQVDNNSINSIDVSPYTITPNGDGIDDELEISYKQNTPGNMGKILIFDIEGNLNYSVLNGGLLGTEGKFLFDGKDNSGNKLTTGYYIVYFCSYSENSVGFKAKKTFVVANTE